MEDINVKVLDEVNKGTTMGMDAIHFVSSKVGDDRFKKVLDVEYGKYKEIANRVDNIYSQYTTPISYIFSFPDTSKTQWVLSLSIYSSQYW